MRELNLVEGNLKNLLPSCLNALAPCKRTSFTMAEILLSLTIIGVVAAITLPSLTGNVNEKTWNTQKKALYARMSQAIALMGNVNGYGQYDGVWASDSVTKTTDTAAETFITEGLSKVLKINNVCNKNNLKDCGIPARLSNMSGEKMDFPTTIGEMNSLFISTFTNQIGCQYSNPFPIDTDAAAFETQNGESIAVFYNPRCIANYKNSYIYPKMCANFVFDLNGKKGPNTFGKDIGAISVLYPTDSVVVAPEPVAKGTLGSMTWENARAACEAIGEGARLPNVDEVVALFFNKQLIGGYCGGWSSTVEGSKAWMQRSYGGGRQLIDRSEEIQARCVKKFADQ